MNKITDINVKKVGRNKTEIVGTASATKREFRSNQIVNCESNVKSMETDAKSPTSHASQVESQKSKTTDESKMFATENNIINKIDLVLEDLKIMDLDNEGLEKSLTITKRSATLDSRDTLAGMNNDEMRRKL